MLSFLAISVELEGRKVCEEVFKTPCVLGICRGEAERGCGETVTDTIVLSPLLLE